MRRPSRSDRLAPRRAQRVALLLADWRDTRDRLADTEQRIVAVLDELGLAELATSITGLSAVGAASILAGTGDPARFATGRALVKHSGLAPRQNTSGTYTGRTRTTGQGRPGLRPASQADPSGQARRAADNQRPGPRTHASPRGRPLSGGGDEPYSDEGTAVTAPDAGGDPYLSPPVDAEQLALLCRYGQERPTTAGQVLFREGERAYDFIAVLSGAVAVVDHDAGVERELATIGPGRFLGELGMLTGERMFATAVVREPGSVLVVPADRFQEVIARDQGLADLIVLTALRRRNWLLQHRAGLQIIGSRSSPDARRLREFAARNHLLHVWVDLDSDPAAGAVLARHGLGPGDAPVVLMPGGEVLRNPSNGQLARAAGFGTGAVPRKTFDVAVVGAGPAGLAASVYGASEGLATAVIDGMGVGGQIGTTSRVENYLGFPVGVSGEEFAQRSLVQMLRFGAALLVPRTAAGLTGHVDDYVIRLDAGGELAARTVIIATGVTYRQLDAAGLDRFEGTGVFYTPLAAQDQVRPGDPVVIVGGGNSAGQAATWLADHGHPVTVVIRGDGLAASMSQYLIDRIARHPAITIMSRCVVREVDGAGRLERVAVEDLITSTRRTLAAAALFVLIGAEPHTQWLAESIELDSHGFIVTGPDLSRQARNAPAWEKLGRDPYLLETSLPGVFAAGDVGSSSVKRVASATGEGSIAIRFATEHLGRRAGLPAAGAANNC